MQYKKEILDKRKILQTREIRITIAVVIILIDLNQIIQDQSKIRWAIVIITMYL